VREVSTIAGDQKQRLKPTPCDSWSQAPSEMTFPAGRVDLWCVNLDEPAGAGAETRLLSADEILRAGRFHFEKDRLHFGRCRSALRQVLAGYIQIPAAEVRFEYLTGGKPHLAAEQNPRSLQFNVSHSAGVALIAVGSEHRLGVDIERIRGDVDTISLAERFFSLRERAGLQALPEHLRVPGFFACWTRKEAFLKATGDGFSFPLADFSVSTDPALQHSRLEEIQGNARTGEQWYFADVGVGGDYRATVAGDASFSIMNTYAWN
jgi:4'-phosphopantetheinyl transferase